MFVQVLLLTPVLPTDPELDSDRQVSVKDRAV